MSSSPTVSNIPRSDDPLTERMLQIYRDALAQLKYPAFRFLGKVRKDGGLVAAKYYLRPLRRETEGFTRLLEHDRLDLSVEAVVMEEPQWQPMFTEEELATARRRLERHGYFVRRGVPSVRSEALSGEELLDPASYEEGARSQVTLNAYERNIEARAACIAHYVAKCVVCDFDFEQVYGSIGHGRIHVHHLTTFAGLTGTRDVDPIADLRPVCSNCHWMLHTQVPPLAIADLRVIVQAQRRSGRSPAT